MAIVLYVLTLVVICGFICCYISFRELKDSFRGRVPVDDVREQLSEIDAGLLSRYKELERYCHQTRDLYAEDHGVLTRTNLAVQHLLKKCGHLKAPKHVPIAKRKKK